MAEVGPHSRPHALQKLDGRTKEARLLRAIRAELTAHLGGKLSAVQRQLVERAAMLTLHVRLFDARAVANGGALTERDSRQYLAYSNALARALKELGVRAAADKPPSLQDYLAEMAARNAQDGGGDDGAPEAEEAASAEPQATPGASTDAARPDPAIAAPQSAGEYRPAEAMA